MPLKHNLNLEDALAQFDAVTAKIVLHPLSEEIENQELRREHVYSAARDTYLAASIWQESLQKHYQNNTNRGIFNPKLAQMFMSDINSCTRALDQVISWYHRIETTQRELVKSIDPKDKEKYKAQYNRLKEIIRERDQISNYQTLLRLTSRYASEVLREYDHRAEIETPADPPKSKGLYNRLVSTLKKAISYLNIRDYF